MEYAKDTCNCKLAFGSPRLVLCQVTDTEHIEVSCDEHWAIFRLTCIKDGTKPKASHLEVRGSKRGFNLAGKSLLYRLSGLKTYRRTTAVVWSRLIAECPG